MLSIKLYVYHLLKYPTIVGFQQLRDNAIKEKGRPSYLCRNISDQALKFIWFIYFFI